MHEAAIDPSQILLKARLKAVNMQLQALAPVGHCRPTTAARFLVCRKRKKSRNFENVSLFISQWTLNLHGSVPARDRRQCLGTVGKN